MEKPIDWTGATVYDPLRVFDRGHCFIEDHPLKNLTDTCLTPDPAKKNILLIGDSYAAHLSFGLKYYFPNVHVAQATASACRAMINFIWAKWSCTDLNKLVFSTTIKDPRFSAIVLASDWQDNDNLTQTLAYIKSMTSTPVVVIGNSPVYKTNPDNGLLKHSLIDLSRIAQAPQYRDRLWEVDDFMKKNTSGATFVSLLDNFCPNKVCPLTTAGGNFVHFDVGHLTEWGSVAVIGASKGELAKAFHTI
jgi:hypothetical protein